MIAIVVSLYLTVSVVFFVFVAIMASIATMFGSLSMGDIVKMVICSFLWPVMIVWGLFNWTVYKVRAVAK